MLDDLKAAIQRAVNDVRPPESMTETRAEYWKAGARAAIRAINEALASAPAPAAAEPVEWDTSVATLEQITSARYTLNDEPLPADVLEFLQALYAAPLPGREGEDVLARGWFHPLPADAPENPNDRDDYEFHDIGNLPEQPCPKCVPALIVRDPDARPPDLADGLERRMKDRDDDECPWFPAWRDEQRRLRELHGDDDTPTGPPTPAHEPRTLQ